eukprot:s357_g41.t1
MLAGYCGPTGVFKTEIRPAKMDKDQLMSDAKFLRPLILGKLKSGGGNVKDGQTLYDLTVEEAQQKEWLSGPIIQAEDKLAPFEARAEMLGVEVDVTGAADCIVVVDNKQKCKDEMANAIQKMLTEGGVVPAKLPSILGRREFAEIQLAGRLGKLAMADVREIGNESKSFVNFTDTVRAP